MESGLREPNKNYCREVEYYWTYSLTLNVSVFASVRHGRRDVTGETQESRDRRRLRSAPREPPRANAFHGRSRAAAIGRPPERVDRSRGDRGRRPSCRPLDAGKITIVLLLWIASASRWTGPPDAGSAGGRRRAGGVAGTAVQDIYSAATDRCLSYQISYFSCSVQFYNCLKDAFTVEKAVSVDFRSQSRNLSVVAYPASELVSDSICFHGVVR